MPITIKTPGFQNENQGWPDLLTAFDGETITYDTSGNPLSYYNGTRWTFTWENGRSLATATDGTTNISYTYDASGLRTSKTVDGVTHYYYYAGGKLLRETYGDNVLDFFYDENGHPYAFKLNGATFYYITNLQGDVEYILNSSRMIVGQYLYDPYGNIVYSLNSTIGNINPLRYRGYYFDSDSGLYYLQSRYYDPAIGRFINADTYASTGKGILGYNMFAYCNNNPINAKDPDGHVLLTISIYDDPTINMFFGAGGNGGCGGTGAVAVSVYSKVARKLLEMQHSASIGVTIGTSSYVNTTGWSGCISADTTNNLAIQSTQTIGASSCMAPGVSAGFYRTYSTADDVQHLTGESSSVGFTICVGVGVSFDFIWFETPTGKTEYALSIGVLWGAEIEVHGSTSYTSSTKSWNPFK